MKTIFTLNMLFLLLAVNTALSQKPATFHINTISTEAVSLIELSKHKDVLLIGAKIGYLYFYSLKNGQLIRVLKPFSANVVAAVYDHQNGQLFAISADGNIYLRNANKQEHRINTQLNIDENIRLISFKANYYFTHNKNLYKIEPDGQFSHVSFDQQLSGAVIFNQRQLLLMTEKGAFRYNPEKDRKFRLNTNLSKIELNDLYHEKNRSVWFADKSGKVCQIKCYRLKERNCFQYDQVVYPDFIQSYWVSRENNQLTFYDFQNHEITEQLNIEGLSNEVVSFTGFGFFIQGDESGQVRVWEY